MFLKRIEITTIALLILGVVIYAAWAGWIPYVDTVLARFGITQFETITTVSGEPLSPEAIERIRARVSKFEALLQNVQTPAERARIERLIAENMMTLDVTKGMQKLRAIASTVEYPAEERARAVEAIADTYFERSNNSPGFAQSYVFTEPPYASMLVMTDQARRATLDAFAHLSEYVISIAPLPISEYRLALWYARDDNSEEAQKHLDAGNALIDGFIATLSPEEVWVEYEARRLRAEATERVGALVQDPELITAAGSLYSEVSEKIHADLRLQSEASIELELVWTNYRHALYNARNFPNDPSQKQRLDEMVRYLSPSFQFNKYLKRLGEGNIAPQASAREAEDVKALATKSEDFASLLRSLGWTI